MAVHADLHWPRDLPATAARLLAAGPAAWLDSAAPTQPAWSGIALHPLAIIRQDVGEPAVLEIAGRPIERDSSFVALWRRTHQRIARDADVAPPNARPRWIGWLGFDLAAQLDRSPSPQTNDLGLPLAWLGLFDGVIELDADARRVAAHFDDTPARVLGADTTARRDNFQAVLAGWRDVDPPPRRSLRIVARCTQTRPEVEAATRRAIEYIAAGDIYQVNLAHRIRLDGADDALQAYLAARAHNPAAYRALIRHESGAVASFSPELMLRVRGREVLTSPIKGTRPRAGDAARDAASAAALLASSKDAAELAMIVDLHRNDLGRVCTPHSVQVRAARRIEHHPSVIHTVGDVAGTLRHGANAIDALVASFPAGSISGVPKLRALEIIRELEPSPRGVYTGAIGWMDLAGDACWSVAIRIVQFGPRTAVLHVGGGIVADSDPAAEYDETRDKARGILHGLGADWEDACIGMGAPPTRRGDGSQTWASPHD